MPPGVVRTMVGLHPRSSGGMFVGGLLILALYSLRRRRHSDAAVSGAPLAPLSASDQGAVSCVRSTAHEFAVKVKRISPKKRDQFESVATEEDEAVDATVDAASSVAAATPEEEAATNVAAGTKKATAPKEVVASDAEVAEAAPLVAARAEVEAAPVTAIGRAVASLEPVAAIESVMKSAQALSDSLHDRSETAGESAEYTAIGRAVAGLETQTAQALHQRLHGASDEGSSDCTKDDASCEQLARPHLALVAVAQPPGSSWV